MADATGVEGGGGGQEEVPVLLDARSPRPRGAHASQCSSHLLDSSCPVGTGDATLEVKEKEEKEDAAEGAGAAAEALARGVGVRLIPGGRLPQP
eukprot:3463120-Pyramimonas_sp.AAC.1